MSDREPEPIYIDGWAYFPQPPHRQHDDPPPPPKKRTGLIAGAIAAGAALTVAIAVVAAVLVRLTDNGTQASDAAQIEATLRQYLQMTSTNDPAYPDLVCAEFREKYAGSTRTDITVLHPVVQSVDHVVVSGDTATALVRVTIAGEPDAKIFDMRREDGRWKACNLDG